MFHQMKDRVVNYIICKYMRSFDSFPRHDYMVHNILKGCGGCGSASYNGLIIVLMRGFTEV